MTLEDDAVWISSLIVGAFLTLYLIPLVGSTASLLMVGSLTWEWMHARYYLQTVFGTLAVFLLLLYLLTRGDKNE